MSDYIIELKKGNEEISLKDHEDGCLVCQFNWNEKEDCAKAGMCLIDGVKVEVVAYVLSKIGYRRIGK